MKREKQLKILELFRNKVYDIDENGVVTSYYHRPGELRAVPFVMSTKQHHSGYPKVILKYKTQDLWCYVHHLIWLKYKGTIQEGLQINHIDAVRSNNSLHNLELVTPLENTRHTINMGRMPIIYGRRKPPGTGVPPIAVIDSNGNKHESVREATRATGIGRNRIAAVLKGRLKNADGYIFKRINNMYDLKNKQENKGTKNNV